jgi:hypothetical protein
MRGLWSAPGERNQLGFERFETSSSAQQQTKLSVVTQILVGLTGFDVGKGERST